MSEEKLVPKLRFNGFTKVWESTKIGEIAEVVGGGTPKTEVEEYWNGEIKWFTPSEIGKTKYIFDSERHITNEGLKNSSAKLLPKNTILLSSRATVGEISIASTECSTNQGFQSLITKNNVDNEFIYYLITTIKNEFLRRSSGSTFLEISKNEIKRIPINIPELSEQNKISNLFSAIDNKIEMLEKKHQYYQDFKKYLMQRIFSSQEDKLRFRNFNENFNEYLISQLFISKKGSGLSKDMIENDGVNKCVLYGELYTNYSEIISEVQSRTNEECKSLSKYGDILSPSSTTTKGIYLVTASVILDDDVYLGGDITILRNKDDSIVNNSYFAYYFSNGLIKDVSRLTQGSTIIHLYWKDFKKVKVMLPSLEEQEKITNILISIDEKLNEINNIIDSMKEFKKGLLQQMFV